MVWGQVAGAIAGQVAGSLLGGGDKRPRYKQAIEAQIDSALEMPKAMVKGAKMAGIHPLYAMGVPTHSPSATVQDSSPLSQALPQIGQDIGRAISAKETDVDRLNKRLLLAQIKGQEIDNAFKASQARTLTQPGSPPGSPPVVDRTIWLRDRDGKMTETLNPDAGDNEMLMLQDWMTRTLPQDFRNMVQRDAESGSSMLRKAFRFWKDNSYFRDRR